MIRRLLFWAVALTTLNDPLLAVGDEPDDPYLWLEDVAGAKALAWVKERNAESTGELTKSEQFQSLERRILEILDSDARIPAIQKLGPYYYNFWRDAKNPRGLWRRTTLEEYRKAKPELGGRARSRRPRQGGEGELGLARSPGAQARVQARPDLALAWRRRRQRGARVRHLHQVVRQGRLHNCPRPRAGSPGERLTVSSSARTSARAR